MKKPKIFSQKLKNLNAIHEKKTKFYSSLTIKVLDLNIKLSHKLNKE